MQKLQGDWYRKMMFKWINQLLFQMILIAQCSSICKDHTVARFDGANVFEDFTDKKNFTLQEELLRKSRAVANEALSLLHMKDNPVPSAVAHSFTIDPEASQCAWLEVCPLTSLHLTVR